MSSKKAKVPSWKDLPPETLLAVISYLAGDGHGLYAPKFLTERGVPAELARSVTTVHKSDGTYKGTMFDAEGNVIPEQVAVYSLTVYRRIADDLGLPGSDKFGRGSEARELHHQIREHLTKPKPETRCV